MDEYLKGREAFDPANRDPRIAKQARTDYEEKLVARFTRQLQGTGMGIEAAESQATAMAADKMKTLAALHNPDLIAGGKDAITNFGDRNINSRIGAQWKTQGRIEGLDEAARRVPSGERGATKMHAKLERCA